MSMPTQFATDQWYVVASVDEVGQTPLARTVCGQHVVLFRDAAGSVVALDDRCSHRGFPLSKGTVIDGRLQCGYHGLTFDGCGACVWVPNQSHIPTKANVIARPVHVTGPWVWMWVGDPANADVSQLPALPWLSEPGWKVLHGWEPLAARYGTLIDNLLDLSHESYLHAGYIGTPEVALTPIETEVDDEANVIRVSRHMSAVECPPFYSRTTGMQTPIDRWQDIEYHPVCCYILHVRVAPAGVEPATDGSDLQPAHLKVLYGITPSTTGSTLDFWALCRDFAVDDEYVDRQLTDMQRIVVLQDVEALNLLETRLAEETEPAEVSFKIDTGGLAARRMINLMTP
jgi:phenylpropionate dioxygenase-like ring-hydroxylating dioxygenase large terminal subunit